MPVYEFNCDQCGRTEEDFFFLTTGDIEHNCTTCNIRANRVFSVFRHKMEFRDGWDGGLGEYVDTKKQRETFMRDKGLRRQRN